MNKQAVSFTIITLIKLAFLIVLVFLAVVLINEMRKRAEISSELTQPPCLKTGKTLAETEKILFDYFELNIGESENTKRICKSYKECFPRKYSKYKTECNKLIGVSTSHE